MPHNDSVASMISSHEIIETVECDSAIMERIAEIAGESGEGADDANEANIDA